MATKRKLVIKLITEQLCESSSSSDDDEELLGNLLALISPREKKPSNNFINSTVDNYNSTEFFNNFHVRRSTADLLIENFAKSDTFCKLKPRKGGGVKLITPKKHVLVYLWFISKRSTLIEVGDLFNISNVTVCRIIERLTDYLLSISNDEMRLPRTEAEKEELAENFEKQSGFPNVIGCTDRTNISIISPTGKRLWHYNNQLSVPSITLQAICDYRKRFQDIFIESSSEQIQNNMVGLFNLETSEKIANICGEKYRIIIGDSEFSRKKFLLTPISDKKNLNDIEKLFNLNHKKLRSFIAEAFSSLKLRFPIIQIIDLRKIDLIKACCVLHNICIDNGDVWESYKYTY